MLDVWDEMAALERRMDELLRSFLGRRVGLFGPTLPLFMQRPFVPTTDVFARDGNMVIRLELPGIDPSKDVSVSVQGGEVIIRGDRERKEDIADDAYYRIEASYGAFERRVPIPETVDAETIAADYADGVLTITVPKAAELDSPQPKEIPVKVAKRAEAA